MIFSLDNKKRKSSLVPTKPVWLIFFFFFLHNQQRLILQMQILACVMKQPLVLLSLLAAITAIKKKLNISAALFYLEVI